LIGILIALGVGAYLYTRQAAGPPATAATRTTVDVAAVQRDLLMLANAERGQLALEGKYATLEELVANGSVPAGLLHRPPYTYSAEIDGASGFHIIATYGGPPGMGAPARVIIDENMHIRTE